MSISETIRVNKLLDVYGSLLTDKQFHILNEYFCKDYSLSEISENYSISRQAVDYTIKQALKVLDDYEGKLKLLSKLERVEQLLNVDSKLCKSVLDILEE